MNEDSSYTIQAIDTMAHINARDWNALVRHGYPFLDHGFMQALETHNCVGPETGWVPRHLCYFHGDHLVAAVPLYEKYNSWGEFVFDHAWADAYSRYGLEYYPKLVCAMPFTPATGQRLLVGDGERDSGSRLMVAAMKQYMDQQGYSGVHCLFPDAEDFLALNQQGAVWRHDCQYHWHNRDYADFDHFLSTLKSRKRKKIRQERRRVREAGLNIRWLDGHTANAEDWTQFTRLYRNIYNRKYGMPAFNREFFMDVATVMPDRVQLVLADHDGVAVAGALMYCDQHTLYGRHWGCDGYFDCLHFELCYYQGIEFCIRRGLRKFDPGAQGEHKVARGFIPTSTRSLHWIADNGFNQAIRDFVQREQQGVQRYIDAMSTYSPYNSDFQGARADPAP